MKISLVKKSNSGGDVTPIEMDEPMSVEQA